jgi:hypothetical protein
LAKARAKVERGDFQTPLGLARAVTRLLSSQGVEPRSVLEPTCGRGAFLQAAAEVFGAASLRGLEIDEDHAREARRAAPSARVEVADFFRTDWDQIARELAEPILVLGNPPWVTSAGLGAIDGDNAPSKSNDARLRGLDARTGRANFDISEWMLGRLLDALAGREATIAVLVKSSVIRRLVERCAVRGPSAAGAVYRFDARAHFDASVDAALLVVSPPLGRGAGAPAASWPVFDSLESRSPSSALAYVGGAVVPDLERWARTEHLRREGKGAWRSGIKHDCAEVFELEVRGAALARRDGAVVDVEEDVVFPLLKGGDLDAGVLTPRRALIVPHRALTETETLARCPRARGYLEQHAERLGRRRSSIYEGRPQTAIFGVGPYSFAPFKVAVSALSKRLAFQLVGPWRGRPVMLDDTCYFVPFDDEISAARAVSALNGEEAIDFFEARRFVEDKRPITKRLLDSLALERLTSAADESSR